MKNIKDLSATEEGGYLLVDASINGDLQKVKKLILRNKVSVHAGNNAALRWSSEYGHLAIVKFLIKQGADIHANGDRSLRSACMNGKLNVVKYLVKQGADTHSLADESIKLANTCKHSEVVKYLLSLEPKMYWITHCNEYVRSIYKEYIK